MTWSDFRASVWVRFSPASSCICIGLMPSDFFFLFVDCRQPSRNGKCAILTARGHDQISIFFYLQCLSSIHRKTTEALYIGQASRPAWELLILPFVYHTALQDGGVQLSAFPKGTTSELAGLCFTLTL